MNRGRQAAAAYATSLALLAGLLVVGPVAGAAPTRIMFVARVHNVYDPGETLRDGIQVGDLMRGTVTYDAATPDTDPLPTVGRYAHRRAPHGFSIEAGPFVFQTDPRRVNFSIVVSNDHGAPPRDSLLLTSANNLPLQNGASITRISWELVDEGLQALASTRLPASAPDLDRWGSEFGVTLDGSSTVEFIIRAHVIEAALCTPQMRCPSPQ